MMRKANANPTKAFFVRMLTRDISLDDCILDLIDNSIDGAWQLSGDTPSELKSGDSLAPYRIEIEIAPNQFNIKDNCGGISLEDAVDYAFTFGRVDLEPKEEFSVGVYGIGMKRAVFKLGNNISIVSTFPTEQGRQAFRVPINVNDWLADLSTSWDFDIEDAEPAIDAGVDILVRELSTETSNRFEDPTYPASLRDVLARDYMLPLMQGLTIAVNGVQVQGRRVELRQGQDFVPMRLGYEDNGVGVEIVAGMLAPPPDDSSPESGRGDEVSGWYVICNGRVVVAADRTSTTGWGGETIPRWHPQFNGFVGIVFFSASDAVLLPMTTTKRNVDVSSAVYRRALVRASRPTRAWIDYTNARKYDLDEARRRESEVASLDITSISVSPAVELPMIPKGPLRERIANVNYAVTLKRMKLLATGLGSPTMSYRDVGLQSFDYTFENLVDEDET